MMDGEITDEEGFKKQRYTLRSQSSGGSPIPGADRL